MVTLHIIKKSGVTNGFLYHKYITQIITTVSSPTKDKHYKTNFYG